MSADVISSLKLDKDFIGGRVLVAKEHKECDSSFITSCVLGHCIKTKCPTLLVLTHNSTTHYQNVGLRMFYNLKKAIECGVVVVFNLGKENVCNLLDNKSLSIQGLLSKMYNQIKLMEEKHGMVNIILDGVTHLFDLQYSLQEVNWLCRSIIKTVRCMNNSFVLLHCNVSSEDDVTHVLASLLSHMANTIVDVQSLSTGVSTDVSGHLTVTYPGKKFEDDQIAVNLDLNPLLYHFKLFDKGVKLFAPGSI